MTKFTLVSPECGDWEALYVDGKLVEENHSIDAMQVLDIVAETLPCEAEHKYIPDEIAERGMPEDLSELNNHFSQDII